MHKTAPDAGNAQPLHVQVPCRPAGCRLGVRGAAHNLNRLLGVHVAHDEVTLASDMRLALVQQGPFWAGDQG